MQGNSPITHPKVSVIIVNYNTATLVKDCIDSIYTKTRQIDFEIIVVDNNSKPEDLNKLKNDHRYKLITSNQNLGFGRANNLGAKYASGDFFFILNPDTLLVNDAISLLYHYLSTHPTVGIAGGNLFDQDMNKIHSYNRMLPSIQSEMDFAFKRIYRYMRYGKNWQHNCTAKPLKVAMITGADIMIPRNVWEQVQGFDPSFFMYCEDADLCKRVANLGYTNISVPEAHIIHLEGQSFEHSEAHYKRFYEGRKKYFLKHYSTSYNNVADFLNIFMLKIAIGICTIFIREQRKKDYQCRVKIYRELCALK